MKTKSPPFAQAYTAHECGEEAGRPVWGSSVFLTRKTHFSWWPIPPFSPYHCHGDFLPPSKVLICSWISNLFQPFLFQVLWQIDVLNGPMNAFYLVALQFPLTLTLGHVTCCGQWDQSKMDESIDLQKHLFASFFNSCLCEQTWTSLLADKRPHGAELSHPIWGHWNQLASSWPAKHRWACWGHRKAQPTWAARKCLLWHSTRVYWLLIMQQHCDNRQLILP